MYQKQLAHKASAEILEAIAARPCALYANQHEIVETKLRSAIIDGSLQPDACLTQQIIADAFGTSRMPVREALRTLEVQGFVRGDRHKTYRVAAGGHATWAGDLPGLLRAVSEQYASYESADAQKAFGHQVMCFLASLNVGEAEKTLAEQVA